MGCDGLATAEPDPVPPGVSLRAFAIATGLTQPMYLLSPPGDARLFVSGGERGLLSMAFHPDYATNGYFYVNYTGAANATHIVRYSVTGDPNRADPASAKLLLRIAQPFANHNGGLIMFGPDRMLYIGMGDGGSGGDPQDHGQNRATLLGDLLRIDVDGGDPYGIPADNPFVGVGGVRPEIWASGLRNPWRFSFDFDGGMLYVADVGQNRREEINVQPVGAAGLNYGWNTREGSLCYEPSSGCPTANLADPLVEYENPGEGCSVTGGYVYRGDTMPQLRGHYFYGDHCRGWVRSFRLTNGSAQDRHEWELGSLGRITSFGLDSEGELYILVHEGTIYRLQP
jgi:glucose/arabinose dehydrogenase